MSEQEADYSQEIKGTEISHHSQLCLQCPGVTELLFPLGYGLVAETETSIVAAAAAESEGL